ncbi:diacylglycerol pyrophosphate phosphatase [Paecilomyces variotii No. 5]|uniref:Diacylglycerol pyrophosphate phosphatase n=1 Tax=Byssochlamys spectabilis (strain No. 5 / NBRC 109023) TaxID=1356009 RepID=V5I513_BYSSN|nr:diacylglycerol pyrophosphate phosphatase [Paecilomyces variotii No. 5]
MSSTAQFSPGVLGNVKHVSKRLTCSYIFDWIIIVCVAAAGGVLYKIRGYQHAFSLTDANISYPLKPNTVSITVVGIVAFLVPAIVILLVSLLLTDRSPSEGRPISPWRRRLWELNAGWLGLGVSLAGAFFVTSALKDLVGKPRPDLLARCDPDLSNIAAHIVGGLGQKLEEAPIIVDIGICKTSDQATLQDGFASFPSGHSSFSWSGLLYLTLWFSAKFSITLPYPFSRAIHDIVLDRHSRIVSSHSGTLKRTTSRDVGAAPPVYLLVLAFVPVGAALYICASRWADYQHHGFDIISGSLIGIFFAWFGFRCYHIPVGCGDGWSWGPRSHDRALYILPGTRGGFAGSWEQDNLLSTRNSYVDVELGPLQR